MAAFFSDNNSWLGPADISNSKAPKITQLYSGIRRQQMFGGASEALLSLLSFYWADNGWKPGRDLPGELEGFGTVDKGTGWDYRLGSNTHATTQDSLSSLP